MRKTGMLGRSQEFWETGLWETIVSLWFWFGERERDIKGHWGRVKEVERKRELEWEQEREIEK